MPILGRQFGSQNLNQLCTVSLNVYNDLGVQKRFLPVWIPGPCLENVELYYIQYGVGVMTGSTLSDNVIQIPVNALWASSVKLGDLGWTTDYTLGSQYNLLSSGESFMIKNDDNTPLKTFIPLTNTLLADDSGRSLVGDVHFRLKMDIPGTMTLLNLYIRMAYRANYSAVGKGN